MLAGATMPVDHEPVLFRNNQHDGLAGTDHAADVWTARSWTSPDWGARISVRASWSCATVFRSTSSASLPSSSRSSSFASGLVLHLFGVAFDDHGARCDHGPGERGRCGQSADAADKHNADCQPQQDFARMPSPDFSGAHTEPEPGSLNGEIISAKEDSMSSSYMRLCFSGERTKV
ncbi:hypothetical protein, partial [Mesorhizobium sp. M7A.F.Ca.MR.148.00.0.0]|uniref:hypothetical protein n=1 Tax=Mesorhizobium sp. M7A.F.Ca.MR.148.00.0.0 TaxID=2496775 RepID=UPI001FE17E79